VFLLTTIIYAVNTHHISDGLVFLLHLYHAQVNQSTKMENLHECLFGLLDFMHTLIFDVT